MFISGKQICKQSLSSGSSHGRWLQMFDKDLKRLIYLG